MDESLFPKSSKDSNKLEADKPRLGLIEKSFGDLGGLIRRFLSSRERRLKLVALARALGDLVTFLPGVALILLSMSIVLAPELVWTFAAFLICSCGILVSVLALRWLALRRRIQIILNSIEKGVVVQGLSIADSQLDPLVRGDEKKTVLH